MVNNERPGVYSSISVSGSLSGGGKGRTIGLAATAGAGEKGRCYTISSYGEAVSLFGKDSSIAQLVKILLLNGASIIEAVPTAINTAAATANYEAAFAVLMSKAEISVMICDSIDPAVHNAMRIAISNASEAGKYRIGVVEGSGDISGAVAKATALNCERLVMVYPPQGENDSVCGAVAAAFAGMLAAGGDPALPVNGAELLGIDLLPGVFSDTEINSLVQGGVTPVESGGGKATVIRGVTTRTLTAGAADTTWRELSTVLIVDNVVPAIRSALRVKFPRVKNTLQTRGAIRTQVIIELESKLKQEIIDSYGNVTAEADINDPTICAVGFEFSVAHGLNRIYLSAHISV